MKILAIGKNYVNSTEEIAAAKPENPIIFSKPATSLVTNNKDVVFPFFTNDLRYEVELVLNLMILPALLKKIYPGTFF